MDGSQGHIGVWPNVAHHPETKAYIPSEPAFGDASVTLSEHVTLHLPADHTGVVYLRALAAAFTELSSRLAEREAVSHEPAS